MSAKIAIVGLGPGQAEYLSLGAREALRRACIVLLRTARHPAADQLSSLHIPFQPLDWIYDSAASMEEVYSRLATEVLKAAKSAPGPLVAYAVPGHPLMAEASVRILLTQAREEGLEAELIPSVSSVELSFLRLNFDPLQGLRVADAQSPPRPDPAAATLFLQLDSRPIASQLKLSLLEAFPAEHQVALLDALGVPDREKITWLPLGELDHGEDFTHLTSLFVPALSEEKRPVVFQELVEIMARLRSPQGCPWDRQQDHRSLRPCLEEETREVLEAIQRGDAAALCEELGDLLLQILFHSQLAAEAGEFDIADVLRGLRDKLIERHPHVFGGEKIATAAEVLEAWKAFKRDPRLPKKAAS